MWTMMIWANITKWKGRVGHSAFYLLPDPFSLNSERTTQEIKNLKEMKTRGNDINNLKFTSDTVLITEKIVYESSK